MIPHALALATQTVFGCDATTTKRLHGGDLSDVFVVKLDSGEQIVAKLGPRIQVEARMLHAMVAASAPVPEVLGVSGDVLFLAHLPEAHASDTGWHALGAGLRILHEAQGADFGWPEDYAFGPVTIKNQSSADWPAFWAERRLLPNSDRLQGDLRKRLEILCRHLPDLLPQSPRKSLLHGDLWTGNALFTQKGAYLIDPACYYGDAEVDLAMLHLFGHPPPAFWDGYGPTLPAWSARLPLYQLWPALVHLVLFGDSYRPLVDTRLARLGF
ncbi:fructosamine kinase family protein [Shimia sp. SDUM112013]|uniref:fructosamine kinase family protein n=1 Tax=Shimia sp. SDUM112013 TaxID=3136160 RepID=UPI0032EBF444